VFKKFLISHAPFIHSGSSTVRKNSRILSAMLPMVVFATLIYGWPAISVLLLSVSFAIGIELLIRLPLGKKLDVIDGNAAVIGLMFGLMLPATVQWWIILIGIFIAIVLAKQFFGETGENPFNPVLVAYAVLLLSWGDLLNFNQTYFPYSIGFSTVDPLTMLKQFGPKAIESFSSWNLFIGQQLGGIGTTFGLGIVIGGFYLILKGDIRWEISFSFIVGLFICAYLFHISNPEKYATPLFHIVTGYALFGVFFLATEDASSPTYRLPMILYGLGAGALTVLIRNIGIYTDGVVFAILLMNAASPLLDKLHFRSYQ